MGLLQVKGLLPDEEKEKIGPKNVVGGSKSQNKVTAAAIISAKPQANPNPVSTVFVSLLYKSWRT
jgi:hypothetical protein